MRCKISPQQAKWVAHSWIILTEYVSLLWYFYCGFKVAIYDDVRQLLHAIKQRSAREKCACLLWCMPWPYVSTSLRLYYWHCAFLGFSTLCLKFLCIYFPFVATRVGPISFWFRSCVICKCLFISWAVAEVIWKLLQCHLHSKGIHGVSISCICCNLDSSAARLLKLQELKYEFCFLHMLY